jgi:hypothetical protein
MSTWIQTRRRRRRWIAVALAVTSAAVPAADARPDLADPRNPLVSLPVPPAQEVEVVTTDSFDWADAGVGAGTAAGVVLLAAAAAATVRRQRRVSTSTRRKEER